MRGLELAGIWGYCRIVESGHWHEVVGSMRVSWSTQAWVGGIMQQGCVGASKDGFWEVVLAGACVVHPGCSKACQTCCSSHLACLHVLRVHVSSHRVQCWVAQVCMCCHNVWVCILCMSCLLCTLVSTQMIINKLTLVAWIINLDKRLLISFDIKNYDLHCFWRVRGESRLMGRSKDAHVADQPYLFLSQFDTMKKHWKNKVLPYIIIVIYLCKPSLNLNLNLQTQFGRFGFGVCQPPGPNSKVLVQVQPKSAWTWTELDHGQSRKNSFFTNVMSSLKGGEFS